MKDETKSALGCAFCVVWFLFLLGLLFYLEVANSRHRAKQKQQHLANLSHLSHRNVVIIDNYIEERPIGPPKLNKYIHTDLVVVEFVDDRNPENRFRVKTNGKYPKVGEIWTLEVLEANNKISLVIGEYVSESSN